MPTDKKQASYSEVLEREEVQEWINNPAVTIEFKIVIDSPPLYVYYNIPAKTPEEALETVRNSNKYLELAGPAMAREQGINDMDLRIDMWDADLQIIDAVLYDVDSN